MSRSRRRHLTVAIGRVFGTKPVLPHLSPSLAVLTRAIAGQKNHRAADFTWTVRLRGQLALESGARSPNTWASIHFIKAASRSAVSTPGSKRTSALPWASRLT